ncbi:PREDICTED: piggyBac transposable element-derived protein 4-like [Rhagoletis zephyria]|uniref:piggyBac transposable element-derived protein 4-like n=1 Tax=Rhagoletis zephyria TaxID=28612 RepID=UPI000811627C|nr:PREDICTED: piggyBac transposable element-derived protein 4-like [Rhagoletis zephyria]
MERVLASRQNRLTESQIQQIIDDDEDIDECSEVGDEDYIVEEFEFDVSSDEYIESGDEESIVPVVENESSIPVYYSKDRDIEWSTEPVGHNSARTRVENITHGRQGVTAYAVHRISNIKESFDLCFTAQMKRMVIQFTNIEGNKKIGERYNQIDEIELDAFLGILILAGVYRSHGESIRSLWDKVHGRPIFRATMPLGRFLEINRVLRFDNRDNSRAQRLNDKLAPIRDFYEKWVANLPLLYSPYENITVDERLIPFRGRCPFLVYMPSKPSKYGMKAWVAADMRTKYCLNFQIYLGKESASKPRPTSCIGSS